MYRHTPLHRPLCTPAQKPFLAWAAMATLFVAAMCLSVPSTAGTVTVKVVDKDGQPAPDVVVLVVTPAKGEPATRLPLQVTIRQEKMRFVPALSIVGLGAKASFVNNDSWPHHVRASPAGAAQFNAAAGEGFELRIEGKVEGKPANAAETTFDKPGAVLLGCHIHGSMRGHVFVSSSPWAVLTDAAGVATFDNVPDGAALVRVWQADQLIDIAAKPVTVGASPAALTVQLTVVPRRRKA